MNFTVAELALAVDKHEHYVRQHIHRGHLAIVRDGRHVSVTVEEALRWASTRGLGFTLPETPQVALTAQGERAARLTLLVWNSSRGKARNLFTLLRHRRRDALGPWDDRQDTIWSSELLGDELTLLSLSGSYALCREHLDRILTAGKLRALGHEIEYTLERGPRNHLGLPGQYAPFRCLDTEPVLEAQRRDYRILELCAGTAQTLDPVVRFVGGTIAGGTSPPWVPSPAPSRKGRKPGYRRSRRRNCVPIDGTPGSHTSAARGHKGAVAPGVPGDGLGAPQWG